MLKGSTVYGRQPVSMAYMLTPLEREYYHKYMEEGSKNSTHRLQMSTSGPYDLCPSSSGAAYAGEPHCVLQ